MSLRVLVPRNAGNHISEELNLKTFSGDRGDTEDGIPGETGSAVPFLNPLIL